MTVVDPTTEERDQKAIVTILIFIKLNKNCYVSVCACSGRYQKISLQKQKIGESRSSFLGVKTIIL